MLFATDTQTKNDLNVFGRHGSASLFNTFNRCTTRGGAAVLEEMLQYPLSNAVAINRRSSIIQFFLESGHAFPFSNSLFEAIEPYLSNRDERTKLSREGSGLVKKISQLVVPDAQTIQVIKGINCLLELINNYRQFLEELRLDEFHCFQQEKLESMAILSTAAFNVPEKPTQEQLAEYDSLLRFTHYSSVQQLIQCIYRLDVYIAVAKVGKERGFVLAEAFAQGKENFVELKSLYHPQVANAVPNNVSIGAGGNVVFLTGANMAGKSTFMKALSTALYLAHAGLPVAAASMQFTVLDGIYTTINLPDNLGMGASHFYAEVMRVKKVAAELAMSKNLFVVFDELFRGTNVKDACEGTVAVMRGFARRSKSLFVISTHIIEAGSELQATCSNISCMYMPTRMQGNKPVYTFLLEKGITDDRHGMVIIRNEGLLDILKNGVLQKNSV